jgi:ABC-type glycerol-3-phosphate transport system substrate-binding protein
MEKGVEIMGGNSRVGMGEWLEYLRDRKVSRRDALRSVACTGFGALALIGARRLLWGQLDRAEAATPPTTIVSWAPAGQRWEFPQRGVLPLFQKKFPSIHVEIVAEPIADMLPKTAVAMAAKSDRYDVIHEDYNLVPQFIAEGALEPLESYLDRDPAFKRDILADVPENVMDLYRDRPAREGGKLYGLPPDSNCQLQYYRADVLEKAGIKKPATTWDEALEIAKEITNNGKNKVVGTTLKRGLWAGGVFITLLRSYGGDWFDKMGPGGWHPTLDSEEGHRALEMLLKFIPYLEPSSLNASDDEANTAMLNGTWQYAPVEWGGSTMNDPKFTKFANEWKVDIVPKGTGPKARFAPHMGGLGLIMPRYSRHKDAAWEWIKFCNYGDKQDPAVARAWVLNTGQPARTSLLREYAKIRPYFAGLMKSLPYAIRYLPIPESNILYETVGTEVAAVVTGGKSPDQALKDMQRKTIEIMTKGGYYKK